MTDIIPLHNTDGSISQQIFLPDDSQLIQERNQKFNQLRPKDQFSPDRFQQDGSIKLSRDDQDFIISSFMLYLKNDPSLAEKVFAVMDINDVCFKIYPYIFNTLKYHWDKYKKLPSKEAFIILIRNLEKEYGEYDIYKELLQIWLDKWDDLLDVSSKDFITDTFLRIVESVVSTRMSDGLRQSAYKQSGVSIDLIKLYTDKLEGIRSLYSDSQRIKGALHKHIMTIDQLLSRDDIQEKEPYIEGILNHNTLVMLAAQTGIGKSFIAYELALAVTNDEWFLGRYPIRKHANVMIVDGEMSTLSIRKRFENLKRGRRTDKISIICTQELARKGEIDINLIDPKCQLMFESILEDYNKEGRKQDIIILDNLSSLLCGVDMNNNLEVEPFTKWLVRLRGLGYTVITVHHQGKNRDYGVRGASKLSDFLDLEIFLNLINEKIRPDHCEFYLQFGKRRDVSPKPYKLKCELIDWEWKTEIEDKSTGKENDLSIKPNAAEKTLINIVRYKIDTEEKLKKQFQDDNGKVKSTFRTHRDELKSKGYIRIENNSIHVTEYGVERVNIFEAA